MNRALKIVLKIICTLVSFALVFLSAQSIFIPKFADGGTVIMNDYNRLDKNSVDVLFMGSSQCFRFVNAKQLTDEFGISSFVYGASHLFVSITPYYLEEALKTQTPKLIMFEVGRMFVSNADIQEKDIAWIYGCMQPSTAKYKSLCSTFDGDQLKALMYTYFPLFAYHDRWESITAEDMVLSINPDKYAGVSLNGYIPRTTTQAVTIDYFDGSPITEKPIPKENIEAIRQIVKRCRELNIKLVFFKTPVPSWTRSEAESIKRFMEENSLEYFDMYDVYDEIGLDPERDFHDDAHVNTSGAEKVTKCLAGYLKESM